MYQRDRYKGKPSSRMSFHYHLDNESKRALYYSMYSNMLMDDIHLGIMPIGGKSRNAKFAVKIDPLSKEVEDLVRIGFPARQGYQHDDLTRTVCDFIDEEAHALAYYGNTYYEIVYYYSDEKRNKIEGFIVESIPPYCVKTLLGAYWQFIPKEVLKYSEQKSRFVVLPRKRIVALSMPKELGGPIKHRKVLSDLQCLSSGSVPEFAMKDMEKQQQTKGYEFSLYREGFSSFLAGTTRHLGWIARGLFSDQSLEIYQIYRSMMFERSKSIIREQILGMMNQCLEMIGKEMGFSAKVVLEGIPTHQDYDTYLGQLLDGTLQFSEAIKRMRI
jgi:hypothetical protein